MQIKTFNWQILAGVLLSIFAFSFPIIFSQWSLGSDLRWLSVGLYAIAAVLVFIGLRRAFATGKGKFSKIFASILSLLSALLLGSFVFLAFVMATWLPDSAGAPQVGQKAPDFTLVDTSGKQVSLADTLSKQKGVLLVFYRGYW
jgi:hypothetical protein